MCTFKVGDKVKLRATSEYYGEACQISGVAEVVEVRSPCSLRIVAEDKQGVRNSYGEDDLVLVLDYKFKVGDKVTRLAEDQFTLVSQQFPQQFPLNEPYEVCGPCTAVGDEPWYLVKFDGRYLGYPESVLSEYQEPVKFNQGDKVIVNFGDKIIDVKGVIKYVTEEGLLVHDSEDGIKVMVAPEFVQLVDKPTPLIIPWDAVDPQYDYAAMDRDGEIYFFEGKPELDAHEMCWEGNGECIISGAIKISRDGIDYKLSLTERGA